MIQTSRKITSDTWIKGTWEEYLELCDTPDLDKAKFYYFSGRMRIEMAPVGLDHSRDHSIVTHAIYLYAGLRKIPLNGSDSCSYRKPGIREAQPDLSFYVGDNAKAISYGTSIVDLNIYPCPDLVIEIAKTSLPDDLGEKRLLYEEFGVKEYWVVNVSTGEIIAFKIDNGGSRRIGESSVLQGLSMKILEEALRRARESTHTEVSMWLMDTFQGS
ncbi:MAG: hypothetical protein N5P05_003464 [Chroococcopsis gigantea SAG 12.99]|jgi:Uma2 family endonuclease|nr:Uma2 family endonuclease [Chlorogloea purpurea SAG 13.99]MDV3001858.1 hypothetical protein [Chroococcopsis gigantea SAG 12.99]